MLYVSSTLLLQQNLKKKQYLIIFCSISVILISVLEVGVFTENHCSMYKHGSTELTDSIGWFNRYIAIEMWEVNYWKINVISFVEEFEC